MNSIKVPTENSVPLLRGLWKVFDPKLSADEGWSKYSMLISAVVPRPIALVSSCAASGTRNCAPFRLADYIVLF